MNSISGGFAEGLATAADDVALQLMSKLPTILPCASAGNRACAETFVTTFARRPSRRVASAERTGAAGQLRQRHGRAQQLRPAIAELAADI